MENNFTNITMERLLTIAQDLSNAYANLATLKVEQQDAEEWMLALETQATPENGWDGKNAEQRETKRQKTLFEHLGYNEKKAAKIEADYSICLLEGEIKSLEAERRAFEKIVELWGV